MMREFAMCFLHFGVAVQITIYGHEGSHRNNHFLPKPVRWGGHHTCRGLSPDSETRSELCLRFWSHPVFGKQYGAQYATVRIGAEQ